MQIYKTGVAFMCVLIACGSVDGCFYYKNLRLSDGGNVFRIFNLFLKIRKKCRKIMSVGSHLECINTF